MRAARIPSLVRGEAVCALIESLEPRCLLSGTFAHAGATAMAYDPAGTLHVAYYDALARSLKYA
ncbi:MAG: hypothetical protein JWN51_1214, partial [Phycisphaerales bacterium]|nr:hypothetical protein [Phycisphaerales bacterium]